MGNFLLALRFLTVFPFGRTLTQPTDQDLAGALNYYSLVGLILGGLLALISSGAAFLGLGLSGNVIVIAVLSLLTGGLHLDGLADTADGIFNCRSREEKLEIMRDSRIGAMGAISLWIILMLKVSLLGEFSLPEKLFFVWFMPAIGRGAMVWSVVKFPYARASGGLGSFAQGAGKAALYLNAATLVVSGGLMLGMYSIPIIVGVFVVSWIVSVLLSRVLGGLTGDTYGAICEIAETLTLLFGVLFSKLC